MSGGVRSQILSDLSKLPEEMRKCTGSQPRDSTWVCRTCTDAHSHYSNSGSYDASVYSMCKACLTACHHGHDVVEFTISPLPSCRNDHQFAFYAGTLSAVCILSCRGWLFMSHLLLDVRLTAREQVVCRLK